MKTTFLFVLGGVLGAATGYTGFWLGRFTAPVTEKAVEYERVVERQGAVDSLPDRGKKAGRVEQPPRVNEPERVPGVIQVVDLSGEYDTNPAKANLAYRKKRIEIVGTIRYKYNLYQVIGVDKDRTFLRFNLLNLGHFNLISCWFKGEARKKVGEVGDALANAPENNAESPPVGVVEVRLVGTLDEVRSPSTRDVGYEITLEDCEILSFKVVK